MKILATGDNHFDKHDRFDECLRVHAWMVDEARRREIDAFLCAGDVYDRASSPEERAAVADWLTSMAEVCPVVIVKGNHDTARDCEILARLRTRHPVIVEERCGVHVVGGLQVAAVAWPDRGSLAAMVGRSLPAEALDDVARECLGDVLRGLRDTIDPARPSVLLTHAMIDGSVTSTGQPLIGSAMNVGLSDLALAGTPLVIAGHIHCAQEWSCGGADILYTGSPYRTAFGETEQKSVVFAEFDAAGRVRWERVPTPARGMFLLEDEWGDDDWLVGWHGMPTDSEVAGAEFRCRYRVEKHKRDGARRAVAELRDRLLALGAERVKLDEEVIATAVARAPDIAVARTLKEKLEAMWRSRGEAVAEERAASVFGKLEVVEQEVRAA